MSYVVVWTLKRGMLRPPEPIDDDTEKRIADGIVADQYVAPPVIDWNNIGEYRTKYVRGSRV